MQTSKNSIPLATESTELACMAARSSPKSQLFMFLLMHAHIIQEQEYVQPNFIHYKVNGIL